MCVRMKLHDGPDELLDQAALPHTGWAQHRHEARLSCFQDVIQQARHCLQLSGAANESSCQTGPPSSCLRLPAEHPARLDRLRFALELEIDRLSEKNGLARRVVRALAGQDGVGFGLRLEARCDIDRIA